MVKSKRTVKHSVFLSFFCFLILLSSNAKSAELRFETVEDLYQDYITNVYTCGEWQNGAKEGYYRIIHIDFLFGCSWLYVQWMKGLCCDGTTKVLHTISVYDNDHHENTFDRPLCKGMTDGIMLTYDAKNGHDNKTYHNKVLVFHQFGQFEMSRTLK